MNQVYLEIGDLESLITFIREARQKGFFQDILPSKVRENMQEVEFPVRIPIDLNAVIGLASNPVIKKAFGKKIETTARNILLGTMEA